MSYIEDSFLNSVKSEVEEGKRVFLSHLNDTKDKIIIYDSNSGDIYKDTITVDFKGNSEERYSKVSYVKYFEDDNSLSLLIEGNRVPYATDYDVYALLVNIDLNSKQVKKELKLKICRGDDTYPVSIASTIKPYGDYYLFNVENVDSDESHGLISLKGEVIIKPDHYELIFNNEDRAVFKLASKKKFVIFNAKTGEKRSFDLSKLSELRVYYGFFSHVDDLDYKKFFIDEKERKIVSLNYNSMSLEDVANNIPDYIKPSRIYELNDLVFLVDDSRENDIIYLLDKNGNLIAQSYFNVENDRNNASGFIFAGHENSKIFQVVVPEPFEKNIYTTKNRSIFEYDAASKKMKLLYNDALSVNVLKEENSTNAIFFAREGGGINIIDMNGKIIDFENTPFDLNKKLFDIDYYSGKYIVAHAVKGLDPENKKYLLTEKFLIDVEKNFEPVLSKKEYINIYGKDTFAIFGERNGDSFVKFLSSGKEIKVDSKGLSASCIDYAGKPYVAFGNTEREFGQELDISGKYGLYDKDGNKIIDKEYGSIDLLDDIIILTDNSDMVSLYDPFENRLYENIGTAHDVREISKVCDSIYGLNYDDYTDGFEGIIDAKKKTIVHGHGPLFSDGFGDEMQMMEDGIVLKKDNNSVFYLKENLDYMDFLIALSTIQNSRHKMIQRKENKRELEK